LRLRAQGGHTGAPKKATGKPKASSTKKASPRPTYDDRVKAIATKARAMACPVGLQRPVPKQVNDIMTVLGNPREALKEAGLTQAQVKAIATGNGDAEARRSCARWASALPRRAARPNGFGDAVSPPR
jgi:hypothetical protein